MSIWPQTFHLIIRHQSRTAGPATFSGLLARSVLETDLRLPGEMCNALFSDCDEAPVSYLSKEIRGGLSIGFQKTWDRLSFGFFVRGMTRLNNRLDVLPAEENRFFVGLGTNPTFTQYGDTFAPLADEVADVGQFIAISDQFRLQPGLMVNWKLNETISVGLITRLDLLTPNEVELLSIGGFRANPEIPITIFAGRSRGYYFQGSFRVAI